MKQNKLFSIKNFLNSEKVADLFDSVRATVINDLADTGSKIQNYLGKQKSMTLNNGFGYNKECNNRNVKTAPSHEQWITDTIRRSLENKQ